MTDLGPSDLTQILLIRHGQSTWNEQGIWQGQADPPLSEFGEQQAAMAANAIGQVDVIAASTQERAIATAAIIGERLGIGPVQTYEGLRERSVGPWSGLTKGEIEAEWPGWIDGDQRPEGWETDVEVADRAVEALTMIGHQFPGASVLVVSHGGVIIAVEKYLNVSEFRIPNLHGRVLYHGEGGLRPGDSLELLPSEMRTGGTGNRV